MTFAQALARIEEMLYVLETSMATQVIHPEDCKEIIAALKAGRWMRNYDNEDRDAAKKAWDAATKENV